MKIKWLLALLPLVSSFSHADTLVESLSKCDAAFFHKMNQQKALKAAVVKSNASDIRKVDSVAIDIGNIKDSGITLTKYAQEYYDLGELGEYYFWGFDIEEEASVAVQALKGRIDFTQSGNSYIYNSLIKSTDEKTWRVNLGAADGIAPAKSTVERVFILNKDDDGKKTTLRCSIQGTVSKSDLLQVRPDLKGTIK